MKDFFGLNTKQFSSIFSTCVWGWMICFLIVNQSSQSYSAVVVTFSPDADNLANTVVSVSGSGSTNNQSQWLNGLGTGYYDLGNPFSSVLNDTDFYLVDNLYYIANQRIVFLRLDDDGVPLGDDFAIYTNSSIPTNTAYNLSGSARVPGLPFAWLNVGTYTTTRQPIGNADSSFAVGGFTLVVSSTPVRVQSGAVPEPTSMACMALLGLGVLVAKPKRSRIY